MKPNEFLAKPTSKYSDWFGSGDSHDDYREAVGGGPEPDEVLESGNMLVLIWPDKVICTGYDGNEYFHSFEFPRDAQAGEAGTAETVKQGSVHEHAVAASDAPKGAI